VPPKKRRPYGTGTLFKRKSDGRWIGRVVVGQDDAGKPIKRQVSDKVKAKAARKLGTLWDEIERVANVDKSL
jgi:hypothetical protein